MLAIASISFLGWANGPRFELENNPDIGQMTLQKVSDLCFVADNTNAYLQNPELASRDKQSVHQGHVFDQGVTLARVQRTLQFICDTYRFDVRNNQPSRLHDVNFIKQHFDFYRWYPDKTTASHIASKSLNDAKQRMLNDIPSDQLFITKYYTKRLTASEQKSKQYPQALYALPFDEQGLSKQQALAQSNSLTRFKYTRQQIIDGALLANKLAQPLVWLSEEALHDVLLQGTGVLDVNGRTRYFNVHRNNGIEYDYALGKREQQRYWYFAEVPGIMGYGDRLEDKIEVRPHVTFAGNVTQLGLGKLIMINYQANGRSTSQMAVLADTGGAFDNNLFQLDLLVDSYAGWSDYHEANKHLPDYAKAWVMLIKQPEK